MKAKLESKFIPFLKQVLDYHGISFDEWLVKCLENELIFFIGRPCDCPECEKPFMEHMDRNEYREGSPNRNYYRCVLCGGIEGVKNN